MVQQPAVDQGVEQRVGRLHLGGTQQRVPLRLRGLLALGGGHQAGLAHEGSRGFGIARVAEQKHLLQAGAGAQGERARQRGAGVQTVAAALAQVMRQRELAPGVKKGAAVAGPVQSFGVAHRVLRFAEKGGAATKPGSGLGLGTQQPEQATARRAHEIGLAQQGGAVAALLAHHPFHQPDDAQVRLARAVVHQPNPHLLDSSLCIDAPTDRHRQRPAPVVDGGEALGVLNLVDNRVVAPGRWRDAPDLAGAAVLQQEPLGWRVRHRVIGPGRELVQAAVDGPGVASAAVGHDGAEGGVGKDVAPWALRRKPRADLKGKGAAVAGERAGGRRQRGLAQAQWHRIARLGLAAPQTWQGGFVAVAPSAHLVQQRLAIGL